MNPARNIITLLSLVLALSCASPDSSAPDPPLTETERLRCEPFSLNEVTLLEGPFMEATQINVRSLLQYEPDRLLAKFRHEAGLAPRAEHYGGWEGMTLAGHSLGHHLSGCAMMYLTTGDSQFLERVNYMVDELRLCQESNGEGYIGAFPEGQRILETEVGKGTIHASSFYLNGIWAPFYTMHKVMAGLRDAYRLCGNKKALEIEKGVAGWLSSALSGLSEDQVQEMLDCEHGGMNEVLADLYSDTGDPAYLELSKVFHHRDILDPLSMGEDILPGKHGNTQIPKLTGLARRYELTGDPPDRITSEFFWERVVRHHSYVNGSHGFHEYFGPADSLSRRLGSSTSESCNVYNMLKLSKHLFSWSASPEVADFYENALINHILSSQHPETGEVLYFHSLQMGGVKEFQDPYHFTCCIGTGMENHSKYGEAIYFKSRDELFVNLFIGSELHWKEKGVILRQDTRFPEEQGTRLVFLNEKPVKLTIQLRIPSWVDDRCSVKVNGKQIRKRVDPGAFLLLKGKWKAGDEIMLEMPFGLRLEPMPDNPQRVALCYGPLVMAGVCSPTANSSGWNPLEIPVLVPEDKTGGADAGNGLQDPSGWLEPVDGEPGTFMNRVSKPEGMLIRPLYKISDQPYTVYWDLLNGDEWQALQERQKLREAELARLDRVTVDRVIPAEDPGSQDHRFESENPGFYSFNGLPSIESRYGWFSFEMKVDRGAPATLMVDYWGGFRGPREFLVIVNGVTLATEDLSGVTYNEPDRVTYPIPASLTTSGKIKVTFESTPDHYAGPVFGIRTLRIKDPAP
jgi:DUF1680 family protein